jgi:hypothetical protein
MSLLLRIFLFLASALSSFAAAVDWRLLGDWAGSGPHAGFMITFSPDGGYVIAQEGIPAGFGSYAVDGRQILLFPGGSGEFPERGAYGFSSPDRLFVMTQNFGRSEWQRVSSFAATGSDRGFEYGQQSFEDKSSFEQAVENLEKLSDSLESMERKLDGGSSNSNARGESDNAAANEEGGKKRGLFDRMKDAARKTASSAGNLSRKAARSVKAAGDAWRKDDDDDEREKGDAGTEPGDAEAQTSLNPAFGGTVPPSDGRAPLSGMGGGMAPASVGGNRASLSVEATTAALPMFGAAPAPVVIDVALAQRAAQVASQWRADASLVEIVAQLGADGSANVATTPQAVSLWFASANAPGEGLKLSLAPDGSFVTAPAPRALSGGPLAPATFIASVAAVNFARQAGLRGEAFQAAFRAVPASSGGARFGWVLAPAGAAPGAGEIVIDAATGQPLR